MTDNSVYQSNPQPRVPLGTPHAVQLLKLVLTDHQADKRVTPSGSQVLCSCSPQAWRTVAEWAEHTARIVLQRLESHLDREARIAEVNADREAGLLCDEHSSVGSQCSIVKQHTGRHVSVWGTSWDAESDKRTGDYIAQSMDGRRD